MAIPLAQATPAATTVAPKARPAKRRIENFPAYERAVAPYRAGTASANKLLLYVLRKLKQPAWASHVYLYDFAGLRGFVVPRHGGALQVLVLYPKRDLSKPFKRDPTRRAARGVRLLLPEVYAHIYEGITHRLDKSEMRFWSHRLLLDAGLSREYHFAPLPDPDSAEAAAADSPWRTGFAVRGPTGALRRRSRDVERLAHTIYALMVRAWIDSAAHSGSGLPGHIEMSDTYIAEALRLDGAATERNRVRRTMQALDAAGFICATTKKGDAFINGKRARAGHYRYLPGTGTPPAGGHTRDSKLTAVDALRAQRRYLRSSLVGPELLRKPVQAAKGTLK